MKFEPNPKPITEQTPGEIDTQIAYWYGEMNAAVYELNSAKHRHDTARRDQPERLKALVESLARAQARAEAISAEQKPFQDEFSRRGGWKRYYHVPKGHVHREMSCSTCTWRTVFEWLPDLSACDETVMVEKYGDYACAVCFPGVVNHPAFIAGAAARKAHEELKRASQCPASAKPAPIGGRSPNGRRGRCLDCNAIVPITKYGLFRQHNPPPAKLEKKR